MAELDPPDTTVLPSTAPPTSLPQPDLPNTDQPPPPPAAADSSLGKRQRRPSVRLGEIGDQPSLLLSYEPTASAAAASRSNKHWRLPKDSSKSSSKTRPLTNLVQNGHQTLDSHDKNFSAEGHSEFGTRKFSSKKGPVRRPRTNWSSKDEDDDDDEDDAFEAADGGSDSPLKDPSPVHSIDNDTLNFWNRRPVRTRVSGNDLDNNNNMPESDSRDRKCDSSADGVRDWLIGLGLGRYAPVFEIHEVDDEVLPLLTLDDLKDMGINAVGSRRKMYTAIQKLRKGFS